MELKPGYKQTEVGVMPEDWKCVPAGEAIRFFGGNGFSSRAETTTGIRWLKIANVGVDKIKWDALSYLPESFLKEYKDYLLKVNDVVMALTRPILNNKLKVARLTVEDEPAFLNQRVAKLIPINGNKLEYLFYVVQRSNFVAAMNLAMAGTDPPNIGNAALEKIAIAIPPKKEEQTAIANALSDADALIQSLTSLITKKRQIKQGAMQTLLNPYENGRLKAEWGFVTYGEVFTFLATASFSRNELSGSGEYGYIHYGDIHTKWDSFVDFKKDFVPAISQIKARNYVAVNDGDLVMADASEDYAGIGKSVEIKGIGNRKIIAGLHTFLLRDKRGIFVNGYKGYIQSSRFVKKQLDRLATGLKVYGVSKANLKIIEIPLPPKNEQTRIATLLSDMDAEIAMLEIKLAKYRQIKQGMMQNLLTGRIRLVKPESNTGTAV